MGTIINHLMLDHGATMEQAKLAVKDWDIRPIQCNGNQVGEIMLKENEVHVAIEPQYRRKLGRVRLLNDTLNALLAEKGFLVTKLFKNDVFKSQIEQLGFALTHSDAQYDYFWMNERG